MQSASVAEERTVLFVDDAPIFRELGALFLARSGRVITAADGREGLALARRERPAVVVADLEMPNLSGDALCRQIKADPQLRATPVILLAPSERAEDRARAVRAGADDVLAKPINRISLIRSVRRLLRFPSGRGLARVPVDVPVRIGRERAAAWGRARNLSRGGIFVEAESELAPQAEVELEFQLPETSGSLSPTAKVVWRSGDRAPGRRGLGLQFLAVDARGVEAIETFVYERTSSEPEPEFPDTSVTAR
jgi:uncharacterized protein (TIGR02266 family)